MNKIRTLGLASAVALLAAQSSQAVAMSEVRLVKSKEPTFPRIWQVKGKQAAQWKQETRRRSRG